MHVPMYVLVDLGVRVDRERCWLVATRVHTQASVDGQVRGAPVGQGRPRRLPEQERQARYGTKTCCVASFMDSGLRSRATDRRACYHVLPTSCDRPCWRTYDGRRVPAVYLGEQSSSSLAPSIQPDTK